MSTFQVHIYYSDSPMAKRKPLILRRFLRVHQHHLWNGNMFSRLERFLELDLDIGAETWLEPFNVSAQFKYSHYKNLSFPNR
jgi:hypothetical protein